jgi:hypothetical protein
MKRPNANKNAAKPNSIMSHYVTIPIGSNGVIDPDEQIQDIITKSMSLAFSPTDIFIYSHGWWTTADAALKEYNIATTDLIYFLRTKGHPLSTATSAPFLIGIHWPSIVDDDPSSRLNFLEPLTFYRMQKRADDIGNEGLYAILRLILNTPKINNLRINLIGHSFGCKVACSALEELATKQAPLPNNISVNLVLLQAAFATDGFDQGKLYEKILPAFGEQIRILVTKSDLDVALKSAFPLAQTIDFFHTGVTSALGYTGPSAASLGQFKNQISITVKPGSLFYGNMAAPAAGPAIATADLTPVHQANATFQGGPGGHHNDIFLPEIYDLICWFLF